MVRRMNADGQPSRQLTTGQGRAKKQTPMDAGRCASDGLRWQPSSTWFAGCGRALLLLAHHHSLNRRQNSPGFTIGIPRKLPSDRRSLSTVTRSCALPAAAVPRIGRSAGSRQASSGTDSGTTSCPRARIPFARAKASRSERPNFSGSFLSTSARMYSESTRS